MAQPLATIGVPTSAGAFAPGQEQAPAALRAAGLLERLTAAGVAVVDHSDSPVWRWRPDRQRPRAQNLESVVTQVVTTASRVRAARAAGQLPLVLGGDCTVEIGTVAGFASMEERIGLLYIDMHADLNVPESVPEGALDWMGMAHLLGEERAAPELSRCGPHFPLLRDESVVIFGHRPENATPWEREVLARRNLRTVRDLDVAADPEGAAEAALSRLVPRSDHLLVHFDVDVVDFTDAPLSENPGRNEGLSLEQALRALGVVAASPAFAALTITELNPDHGEADGATLDRFVAGLVNVLSSSPAVAKMPS